MVLPFWYRLTQVVPDKGPLNARARVCVCVVCLFISYASPLILFLHFFLIYLLRYLSFPLRIDPAPFPGQMS